ncbi:MAG TPA: efflux RND transporter periplasmic adaptor subunit [Bryobacteraceae bacterium]|nr:efflux RND transporter periplasmic adaptor subunit [Bryobacteraceae bacterium]HXR15492.1 efflux RND transporter periplasmic adaptor subunit [Terriglobales bacterium]
MFGHTGSSQKRLVMAVLVLGVLVAAALLAGYLPRRNTTQQLDSAAAKLRNTPLIVNAAKVTRAPNLTDVSFPGSITPITEAYMYARAAGYLKRRYVDIGDRVSAGQLLAEIDAPDLDQQVTQAQAALSQAEGQLGQAEATLQQLIATRDLAAVTWQRYQVLTKTGAVSRQAGDTQMTAAKTAEANVTAGEKNVVAARDFVRASKATLDRLVTLQGYEKVTSPFAGVVTARNVDIGALISATGSTQGPTRPSPAAPSDVPSSGEIFRVAQIGRLRVLVSLPQSEAAGIHVGQPASVSVEELPNRLFPGQITRTSNALDAASRTLLTEVQVANPTGVLLPGMYTTVRFATNREVPPFLVPDASLVVEADGTTLAVLRPLSQQDSEKAASKGVDKTVLARARIVHFQKVQPGRDYGTTLEILDGLHDGEYVVVDPGDAVKEGAIVQMAESAAASNSKEARGSSK